MVDKGLARGGIARVPEGDDLENAVAGLPPVAGSGEDDSLARAFFSPAEDLRCFYCLS